MNKELLEEVLKVALSTGADYAEVFVENTSNKSIEMINNKVESIKDNLVAGVSVRIFKGLRSVSSNTADITREGMLRCATKAADALAEGKAAIDIVLTERTFGDIHPMKIVPSSVANKTKIDILKDAYFTAKNTSDIISQVTGRFLDVDHNITIANSEGLLASDRQIRTRLAIQAVASKNGEFQTGACSPGKRLGLEMFDEIDPKDIGRKAAKQALTMIDAKYCPAGKMTVAIGNGFGGVIFHEACGHSLEASCVSIGASQFAGKIGEKIANEKVTAIDDGTIPNAWGSINIDDEGTPARKNVLIENGVLKSYMVDKFNGRRMGLESTGNARRESYAFVTTSRMTNTYIANGEDKNEDIIKSIENGIYAKEMGGGSVNPVTGEFNFAVREGYIIKNGEIKEPVRGASLVGKGSEVIKNIDMVGTDMEMAAGMCGASSGSIPTNVGQPLIRVSNITVGGR